MGGGTHTQGMLQSGGNNVIKDVDDISGLVTVENLLMPDGTTYSG
jgi:hypothetical protein